MIDIDKGRVLAVLRERVAANLAELTSSQHAAQAGAIHEETRAEDPKDMRSTEASYLARGLAQRVDELREAAERLAIFGLKSFGPDDPVALSALVGLEDEAGARSVVFVVPVAGGEDLEVDGVPVRSVTSRSPLGEALIGAERGDVVEIELPGGAREWEVAWIS